MKQPFFHAENLMWMFRYRRVFMTSPRIRRLWTEGISPVFDRNESLRHEVLVQCFIAAVPRTSSEPLSASLSRRECLSINASPNLSPKLGFLATGHGLADADFVRTFPKNSLRTPLHPEVNQLWFLMLIQVGNRIAQPMSDAKSLLPTQSVLDSKGPTLLPEKLSRRRTGSPLRGDTAELRRRPAITGGVASQNAARRPERLSRTRSAGTAIPAQRVFSRCATNAQRLKPFGRQANCTSFQCSRIVQERHCDLYGPSCGGKPNSVVSIMVASKLTCD